MICFLLVCIVRLFFCIYSLHRFALLIRLLCNLIVFNNFACVFMCVCLYDCVLVCVVVCVFLCVCMFACVFVCFVCLLVCFCLCTLLMLVHDTRKFIFHTGFIFF